MVSASKERKPGRGGPGTRGLAGSRVCGSLPMRGFKIFCEEEKVKKKGNVGFEGADVVSRNVVKPPVVARKSFPSALSVRTSVFTEPPANKSNPKNITKCMDGKENSDMVNMKAGRKALADVSNIKNGRSYQFESNSTRLKKGTAGKSIILKSKVQGTKNLESRKALTKSTVTMDMPSKKVATRYQVKDKAGDKYGKHCISASNMKEISRHRRSVRTNATIQQDHRCLITGNNNSRGLFHRPSLSGRKSVGLNISSKKVYMISRCKSSANSGKPMPIFGIATSSSGNAISSTSSLDVGTEKSQNNIADKQQLSSTECCVENVTASKLGNKCIRRKSYTMLLMTGHEVIGRCTSKADDLPEIDNHANPLEVVEYIDDIYQYYWIMEDQNTLAEDYLSHQTHITPRMRGVLINWLIEVHLKFALMQETLFLMVELLDRALSVIPIEKDELQLVGLTSLLLASKYEDFWHPKVKDLISISVSSYTKQQMLTMEMLILRRLRFRLNLPTPYVFMLRFLKASQSGKMLEHLAFYFIELCLVQYEALRFKPSLLCASAVYLARCTLRVTPVWSELLRNHTHYEEEDLRTCANMILGFQKAASTSRLETTYEKFLDPDLGCVAKIKPIDKLHL